MPTEIYKTAYVQTIDGQEIEIMPLKIKFLKQFMLAFDLVKHSKDEEHTINILSECARVAMKQHYPKLSNSSEDIQDNFDLSTIYEILEYSAGIKMTRNDIQDVADEPNNAEKAMTWEDLDLVELETEVFVLGIWKNFDELETSISIEELMKIISTKRDLNYEEKKFLAALKGIDLDAESGASKGQKEWEDMKARVFSGGATGDSKDILALQGQNAKKAGFGIGMGLSYEDHRDPALLIKKT